MRAAFFSVCAITILFLAGCLRYTPSRAEIARDHPDQDIKEATLSDFADDDQAQIEQRRQFVQTRLEDFRDISKQEYHIGAGDMLEISVFDLPELNSTVQVQPGGKITLALLNDVQVSGKSAGQLQRHLEQRLRPFVISPRVKVQVSEFQSQRVSVVGAVEKPGVYPLKQDRTTLLSILSTAGGRRKEAGTRIVLIPANLKQDGAVVSEAMPMENQLRHGFEFFFDDITQSGVESAMLIPLIPGDTVVVPEAGSVQIDGDVKKPGAYPLGGKMSVLGAVAAAGGLQYSADVHAVEVIRDMGPSEKAAVVVDLEQVALKTDSDFRLRDGDVIRVPSASGRFAGQQTVEFINGIFSVGVSGSR